MTEPYLSPSDPTPPISPPPPGPPAPEHTEGLSPDLGGDEEVDRTLARIEMEGEEVATGWKPSAHPSLAPEVRYLHVSRTIHELITDRNRSVGIFLAVASLLIAGSTALLGARPDVVPIIPIKAIQYWCFPVTFGTLAVMGVFMCLILVRARIGLIFEVSKMNALLGLPAERVRRVNPLSIFYLMYLLVALLGGASFGLTVGMLVPRREPFQTVGDVDEGLRIESVDDGSFVAVVLGLVAGIFYMAVFLATYYVMVLRATSDERLANPR